jgi:hypothetical protein
VGDFHLLFFASFSWRTPKWVKTGRTRREHMSSALPLEADFAGHRAKAYPRPTVLVCLVVLGSAGLVEMVQLLTPDRHSRLWMRSRRWPAVLQASRLLEQSFISSKHQPQVLELTRSADIKLNARISLMRAVTIVSSSQLRGVSPRPPTTTARSGVAASRKGTAAPPIPGRCSAFLKLYRCFWTCARASCSVAQA